MDIFITTCEHGGKARNTDPGPLYDPGRRGEAGFCARWKTGHADGFSSQLRGHFARSAHLGIELEINQGIVMTAGRRWAALRRNLTRTLRAASASLSRPPRPPLAKTGEQSCE